MWRSLFSRLLQCLLTIYSWINKQDQYCSDLCSRFLLQCLNRSPFLRCLRDRIRGWGCSDLWSRQLQQDIVDNILGRLGALDRIRFGAVCTCWRAAVRRSKSISALDFPFVLHAACSSPKFGHSILSLDDNRYYNLNRLFTEGRKLLGTIEGRWLIMSRKCNITIPNPNSSCPSRRKIISHSILNPVTGMNFMFPPLLDDDRSGNLFEIMVASSEPTTTNCMLAGAGSSSLAFCRLTDSRWTFLTLEQEFEDLEIYTMTFLDGKLYASGRDVANYIIAFDLRHENKNGVYKAQKIVMTAPSSIFPPPMELRLEERLRSFYLSFSSLASDLVSRELLLITGSAKVLSKEILDRKNYEKVEVSSFRVYKMNKVNNQNRWIQITNLDDRILFHGNGGSFFMPSKVFETRQDNSIYYALKMKNCCDVGKFCLNDQTVIQFPIGRRHACGWFIPRTN